MHFSEVRQHAIYGSKALLMHENRIQGGGESYQKKKKKKKLQCVAA